MVKYSAISDLPMGVKDNLPREAQKIYKSVFNTALDENIDIDNPKQVAHRLAWATVKQSYEQVNGKWRKKG